MKKLVATLVAAVMAVGIIATAASAAPKVVVGSGVCSGPGRTTWLLTLKKDANRIEADSEVNHSANGQAWKSVFKDNGVVFARSRVVAGSPGNEARQASATRYVVPVAGANHITVRSTNLATGQVCVASATF
jgi:hypothetical protein